MLEEPKNISKFFILQIAGQYALFPLLFKEEGIFLLTFNLAIKILESLIKLVALASYCLAILYIR